MDDVALPPGDSADLHELVEAFDELGSLIHNGPSAAYQALVKVTVDWLPGADWASVSILRGGTFRTEASSHSTAERGDGLQYSLGSGPCVDAVVDQSVFHANHLRHDDRWPEFGPKASSTLGIESMLAYRLLIDDERVTAGLNIYSRSVEAFDEDAVSRGFLLATHGAVAVNAAMRREEVDNLRHALESNRVIATAVGILMAQHTLSREQAFNVLSVASQRTNRKVQVIAEKLIENGTLDMVRFTKESRSSVDAGSADG